MCSKYTELYHEWFENKDKWFSKSSIFDKYISEKYFSILCKDDTVQLKCNTHDKAFTIGTIIAYDQVPRHYNRITTVNCREYSLIARDLALEFMSTLYTNLDIFTSITANEWCFIFLPFRHIQDIQRINFIIEFIINKHNSELSCHDDKKIYKKFLYYCIRDIYKLNTQDILRHQNNTLKKIENYNPPWSQFQSILEHYPTESIIFDITKMSLEKEFITQIQDIDHDNLVIVSISGGVDSFVCLHLLKKHYPNKNIVAVHINYNNRKECKNEINFIKSYCSLMKIQIFHRKITEITRDSCRNNGLRDLYEEMTKKIRYDTYKQVAGILNKDKYVVLLGHNKDDCFENIITNISMKYNYKNLSGFEVLSNIDSILFWRPLLNVRKIDIIQYAKNMNIPFLQDSTPEWSMRGKIRDKILPNMQEINPEIVNSFIELKKRLSNDEKIIEKYVIPKIINKMQKHDHEIVGIFDLEDLICDINVWSMIFKTELFDNLKISFKCLKEYIAFLERFITKSQSVEYESNDMKFVINKHIYVSIILKKEETVHISFKMA
jgi:tRNA(Ile)-lysidine synthetase-like protein